MQHCVMEPMDDRTTNFQNTPNGHPTIREELTMKRMYKIVEEQNQSAIVHLTLFASFYVGRGNEQLGYGGGAEPGWNNSGEREVRGEKRRSCVHKYLRLRT